VKRIALQWKARMKANRIG